MRMMDKKWDNELYHSENDEEDNTYDNDKEEYLNAYWRYVNNGDNYAE